MTRKREKLTSSDASRLTSRLESSSGLKFRYSEMKTLRIRFHRRIVGISNAEASSCSSFIIKHRFKMAAKGHTDSRCQTWGKGSAITCRTLTPRWRNGTWSSPIWPRLCGVPWRGWNQLFQLPGAISLCPSYSKKPPSPRRRSADAIASKSQAVSGK